MISKSIRWVHSDHKLFQIFRTQLTRECKGAIALFFVKIFLVIPFGAIYSSLILYMTRQLHMVDIVAANIVASSLAYMAIARLLIGWLGGQLINYFLLLAVCISLMVIGCIFICIPSLFNFGMAAIILSSGSMVAVNCLLTQLFQVKGNLRDVAFIWNYTGIQIGNTLGYLLGGYCQLHYHNQSLFLLAALSSFIALMVVCANKNYLTEHATSIIIDHTRKIKSPLVVMLFIFSLYLFNWLLQYPNIGNSLVFSCAFILFAYLYVQSRKQQCDKIRTKINLYLYLIAPAVLFWAFNYLAPVAMLLFLDRHVDRQLFGYVISPQWIQMISALTMSIGGPLLCMYLIKVKNRESLAVYLRRYAIAFFAAALSVGMLCFGLLFSKHVGMVSFSWVFVSYFLQGVAELLIAPVGYSMVGYLAPYKLQGLMMAGWIGLMSLGAIAAGIFSRYLLAETASFLYHFSILSVLMLFAAVVMLGLMQKITCLSS